MFEVIKLLKYIRVVQNSELIRFQVEECEFELNCQSIAEFEQFVWKKIS